MPSTGALLPRFVPVRKWVAPGAIVPTTAAAAAGCALLAAQPLPNVTALPSLTPPVVSAPSSTACANPKLWMLLPIIVRSTTSHSPGLRAIGARLANGNRRPSFGPPQGCGAAEPLSGQ